MDRASADDGFTIVELLVVVLLIGVLAAIVLPTFLNQRERAWDVTAQSMLRNAMNAQTTIAGFEENRTSYSDNPERLTAIDPTITWVRRGNPGVGAVHAWNESGLKNVNLGTRSRSGRCYYLRSALSGPVPGTTYEVIEAQPCPAVNAVTIDEGSW